MKMDKIKTFNEYLYDNEKQWADVVFLRQPIHGEYREFTWKEVMDQARRVTTQLKKLGLKKGDKVSILSKNCAEWVIAKFAILLGGYILVPLYATQHKNTVRYILDHAEVKAIFVGKLDNPDYYEDAIPEHMPRIAFPYENPMKAELHWDQILAENEPEKENYVPDPQDLYMIMYTSGTTGNPKGVMITFEARSYYSYIRDNEENRFLDDENEYVFSYLPLGHIAEMSLLYLGVTDKITFTYSESLDTFFENLKNCRPTFFFAVPRIWTQFQKLILSKSSEEEFERLITDPREGKMTAKAILAEIGLDRCKYPFTGAAPITIELIQWYKKLGLDLSEVYGQTENLAVTATSYGHPFKLGTVGRPYKKVEVKISDEGEILTRSKATMLGYYKNPEATAASFTEDGFLKSGDMGKFDEEGNLIVLGRIKDPFKTAKGEYVNPIPIEAKFSKNSYIEQACLIGLGLPQPILLVVLSAIAKTSERKDVEQSLKKTLNSINKDLTKFEKVSHIIIVKDVWTAENELLTATLKMKRNVIHAKYIDLAQNVIKSLDPVVWEEE